MSTTVRTNMGIASRRFNSFFLAGWTVAAAIATASSGAADSPKTTQGTQSSKSSGNSKTKKEDPMAILRFFTEVTDDGTAPKIEVIRSLPQTYPITKEPFMDERDIARAQLMETADGGFMIQVDTTNHGRQTLEMTTVGASGKRVVIFGQWNVDGQEKPEERWLAAPLIRSPIHTGSLVFSADCSREEAQRIVEGMNNVAVKLKNQPKSKSKPSNQSTQNDKSKQPTASPNSKAQDAIDKASK